MSFSYVYKIVNTQNGKCYVGKSNDPNVRFIQHVNKCNSGDLRPLYAAMRKYGIENFEMLVIESCQSEEEAYERETHYIRNFLSSMSEYGYNLNEGGKGGISPSESTRFKISTAMKGRVIKRETCERLRISHLGKKQSSKTIEKRSQANRGKKRSGEVKSKISLSANSSEIFKKRRNLTDEQVLEILKSKETVSNKEAAIKYGVSNSAISAIRLGRTYRHVYSLFEYSAPEDERVR